MNSYATRDVSTKSNTLRTAKAIAVLRVLPVTLEAIRTGNVPKADPIGVAKVAGIQSAKNTSLLIPYCHQVPLDFIGVDIELGADAITVTTTVKAIWKTGVEMEALVAASTSALALYDMLKIIDSGMEIVSVRLVEKKGGKSSIKESGEGLTAAVLVLSDSVSGGRTEDQSGKVLVEKLKALRIHVSRFKILPDDCGTIEKELKNLADNEKVDLIVTTGGTGISPRDVTPEATLTVIERRLEGVEETLRNFGQNRLPTAMLSRVVVGIRGKSLIVNLPGSKGGVEDGMNAIFPSILHTFRMMKGEGHD
ncbi:MAG: bifunctional molybdenum cofactor biosynthesis protein MoaC/MoaB [Ignavibacteriae bacterium]|nr:bifunctional molybdenum cofactor biosynthesis protein MoaC/MoaB [Ignavibacteria bacterium]MBI3363904.1 bifunctional molybdenum cofactor biosynthesis protein MoaC/MoaB [Ignavibacteriota bacterium]